MKQNIFMLKKLFNAYNNTLRNKNTLFNLKVLKPVFCKQL